MKFKTEAAFYLNRALVTVDQVIEMSDLPLALQLLASGKISPADPETETLIRSVQHPAWEPLSELAAEAFATQARFANLSMPR